MSIERLRALENVVELVAKATPGPWRVDDTRDDIEVVGRPAQKCRRYGKAGEWTVAKVEDQDFDFETTGLNSANAIAIAAAVNFIREHGSALIAELGQEVGAEQAPVAYMEPVTFNAASPADFAEALRKWPDDYDNWFPVYSSPAHTSEARDADVKAMDVLSLAELVDAAVCLESCEAAWCGDEMELAAPRRRLAKAYSGLRKTLFIAQDAIECALRNSKRGSRTNAACSTALEYLRRATKQSDDAVMRQERGNE